MSDNFNFICADCGPSEGDPAFTDDNHRSYCAECNPKRGGRNTNRPEKDYCKYCVIDAINAQDDRKPSKKGEPQ